MNIVLSKVSAIKISPALLALDELGNIGVKTVNEGIVKFTPINIVKSESDGNPRPNVCRELPTTNHH